VASASHGEVIVDLTRVEARGELLAKLLASAAAHAKELELTMSVVGTGGVHELMASFEETKNIPCFGTVREARAAGS
jgi:anti-anti-sigma regulatory factor